MRNHWLSVGPQSFHLGFGVELRRLQVDIRNCVVEGDYLRVDVSVADRDTGDERQLIFKPLLLAPSYMLDSETFRYAVKHVLMKFFEHELDELLLLNGQRKDPHL